MPTDADVAVVSADTDLGEDHFKDAVKFCFATTGSVSAPMLLAELSRRLGEDHEVSVQIEQLLVDTQLAVKEIAEEIRNSQEKRIKTLN